MKTTDFSRWLDIWTPEKLKSQNDPFLIIRAKILLALYLSTLVTIVMMIIFLLLVIPTSNANWMHGVFSSSLAFILLALQIFIFYRVASIAISCMIFSMTFFSLTLLAVIMTGGWLSPLMMLFFCSPVISFLVGGRTEGLYIIGLVFFSGAILMIAHTINFTLFQIVADENIEVVRFSIWIASSGLLVSCLTTYDFLLESSMKNQNKEKASWR